MSRRRRPSRVPTASKPEPHKRNLIGPHKILASIEQAGGVPDEVIEELSNSKPSAAAERAGEYMSALGQWIADSIDPEQKWRVSPPDSPAHRIAWLLSVTNSMKESVPPQKRCRHIRAADPQVTEIRTVAVLSAGRWECVECFKQAGVAALGANLWPNECDLCGAYTEKFNEIGGNIAGCSVSANACERCAGFGPG